MLVLLALSRVLVLVDLALHGDGYWTDWLDLLLVGIQGLLGLDLLVRLLGLGDMAVQLSRSESAAVPVVALGEEIVDRPPLRSVGLPLLVERSRHLVLVARHSRRLVGECLMAVFLSHVVEVGALGGAEPESVTRRNLAASSLLRHLPIVMVDSLGAVARVSLGAHVHSRALDGVAGAEHPVVVWSTVWARAVLCLPPLRVSARMAVRAVEIRLRVGAFLRLGFGLPLLAMMMRGLSTESIGHAHHQLLLPRLLVRLGELRHFEAAV